MPESIIVEIDGIGPILFERSLKAKNVSISIKPFKGVRVAVPEGISFHKAGQLIQPKKNWIKKSLAKMKQLEKQNTTIAKQWSDLDWRKAEERLTKRAIELARKHGFSYQKITIRNQKTRWGSCSSKDNISLNIQLSLLSQELIDYVILHELVHTHVKNHSKEFWLKLDKYVGDAKALNSKLGEYTPSFSNSPYVHSDQTV